MSTDWRAIAFQLEPDMVQEVNSAWAWLVPEPWSPVVCSMVPGIFLEKAGGDVHWLDTGTAFIEKVADTREQFEEMLRSSSERVEEWFLPGLVEQLREAGKIPAAGQCYGFTILPVFAEGKYEVENMFVLAVREQFVALADVHRQLNDMPDGASVQFKIVD
jgi:hypothetical protein